MLPSRVDVHAIDTHVLVRLLTGDDPRQAAAAERFVGARGGWVSHVVLVETVWVLDSVYARTREQIGAAIEQLLDHAALAVQDPELVTAALAQFRRHKSAGFSDCVVLELARKAGHLPLGTFDKGLSALDGAKRI